MGLLGETVSKLAGFIAFCLIVYFIIEVTKTLIFWFDRLKNKLVPPTPEQLAMQKYEARERMRVKVAKSFSLQDQIIGRVYLVARRDFTEPELWLAESDETPYGLYMKFGWYRHKQSRNAGSSTHQFHHVASDVMYDPDLHKLYTPSDAAKDERQVRLYRYKHTEYRPELYDLYVVVDRVNKRISNYYVAQNLLDEFHADAQSDPFKRAILAASNVRIPLAAKIDSLLSGYQLYRAGATP